MKSHDQKNIGSLDSLTLSSFKIISDVNDIIMRNLMGVFHRRSSLWQYKDNIMGLLEGPEITEHNN